MTSLVVATRIEAPIERCFDLARSIEAHNESAAFSDERAIVPGRTSGLMEVGDLVTFEATHFGMRQRVTARITEMVRPNLFVDELVESAFHSLRHIHDFREIGGVTIMTDALEWRSPFGPLGVIADALVIKRHMRSFLERKQGNLKRMAEAVVSD